MTKHWKLFQTSAILEVFSANGRCHQYQVVSVPRLCFTNFFFINLYLFVFIQLVSDAICCRLLKRAVTVSTLNRSKRNDLAIIRWMCYVQVNDQFHSDSLLSNLRTQNVKYQHNEVVWTRRIRRCKSWS